MATHKLLLLPGDGIGPEVMREVEKIVGWFRKRGAGFETETDLVGGSAYDAHGAAISEAASRSTWATPLGDRSITSTCPSPIRWATARAAAPGAPPISSTRMPCRSGRASTISARRGDSDDVMSLVKQACTDKR